MNFPMFRSAFEGGVVRMGGCCSGDENFAGDFCFFTATFAKVNFFCEDCGVLSCVFCLL